VPVSPDLFREALAQHASGVTVVTVSHAGQRFGFTASSFTSVSLDPPLVLVCAARTLDALAAIESVGAFAVNILGDHQHDLGLRFAGLLPDVTDRFDGIDALTSVTGSPLLPESLAWLDCRLHALHDGGDHRIVVGEVVDARVNRRGRALLYHGRRWRRVGPEF
jgi:flavin reductase (DIM6/NTAB) family NADH-FMN oxidoreductase RutF